MNQGCNPSLLTVDDVANLLQVKPRTIWRWRSEGRIPIPVKVKGSVRWIADEIQKWIAGGCQNLAERQNASRRK